MMFKAFCFNKKNLTLGLGLVLLFALLPSTGQAIISPVWDAFDGCNWLIPSTCFDALFSGFGKLFDVLLMVPIWVALGPIIGTIAIGSLIGIFGSFIFYALASLLLQWVTSDAFVSLPFTSGGIVTPGLAVTTSLVNMFFIIVLVFIAFATILRLETYGLKKLLPKFLIILLLINFVPVITGMVIDIANIVTDSFLTPDLNEQFLTVWVAGMPIISDFYNNLTGGKEYVCLDGDNLTNPDDGKKLTCETTERSCTPGETFSCGNDITTDQPVSSTCPTEGSITCKTVSFSCPIGNAFLCSLDSLMQSFFTLSGFMGMLFKAGAVTFFGFFAGFILLLYVLLFMIRIIALWILVILAPIAWFLWILPPTQKVFKMWWNYFLQWAFVGAIAGFFLWLAGRLIGVLGSLTPITMAPQEGALNLLTPIISSLNWFFAFGTVIVFLIIGFIISIKTSSGGAEIIMKAVERGGRAASKIAMPALRKGTWSTIKGGKESIRASREAYKIHRGLKFKTRPPETRKEAFGHALERGRTAWKLETGWKNATENGVWSAVKDSAKAGWGAALSIKKKGKKSTKKGYQECPLCNAQIAANAKSCRSCGFNFD